jgi:hypothetical protein
MKEDITAPMQVAGPTVITLVGALAHTHKQHNHKQHNLIRAIINLQGMSRAPYPTRPRLHDGMCCPRQDLVSRVKVYYIFRPRTGSAYIRGYRLLVTWL